MTSHTPVDSIPKKGKGLLLALMGLLAGGGALAFALFAPGIDAHRTLPPPPPKIPEPDTSHLEPRVAEAIRAARETVVADPEDAEAWILYAKTLNVHDVYAEAAQAYRRAIELKPEDPELNYLLALVLWHVPDGAVEAEGIMTRMAELQPKYPPPLAYLGTWFAAENRHEAARVVFEMAIEIDSTFAYAHRELGKTLLALGQVDKAMMHLRRAVELIPADRDAHMALAEAYQSQGNPDQAQTLEELALRLDDVIKLNDPVREALEPLGVSGRKCYRRAIDLMREGKFSQADKELVTVRETIWDQPDVHLGLADVYNFRDRKIDALREYREVLRLREDDLRAHLGLATILNDRKQFTAALEHWRKAIEAFPNDPQVQLGFANCLAATGNPTEAITHYQLAAALIEPTAEVLTNWATALMRTGASDDAVARYKQAIERDPKFADAHFNLGMAYEKLDRTEDAITEYRFGVMLNPKHPGAKRLEELEQDQSP